MNEQLNTLVKFVNADKHRFMQMQYAQALYPDLDQEQWKVEIFLGPDLTCDEAFEVGRDHWLQAKASSYQQALQAAVKRLETVRAVAT
jgi:hypothetical protein